MAKSQISKLKKYQLQNSFVTCNESASKEIFFVDVEDERQTRGILIEKLFSEDFSMKQSRNDLCFCGSGKKYKKCHPNINPESIIAHQYRVVNFLEKEILTCPYTVCKKGCGNCCTDDFEISVTEFFTILNYLKITCTDEQIDKICSKASMKISSVSFASDSEDVIFSRCIFLNETSDCCDIYEVRPIICRKYGHYENTDCEIINADDKAKSALIHNSLVDTMKNINFFEDNGKITFQKMKTIAYWFSRLEGGEFKNQRMNDLFNSAVNSSISEYIRILRF